MKSTFSLSCAAIALLAGSCTASNPTLGQHLEARWVPLTYKGCYSSAGTLKENGTYEWQTQDYCQESMCGPAGYSVEATSNSTYCYCGSEVPSSSYLVDDSLCNSPCAGFGTDNCGGETTFSVYLTGVGTVSGTAGVSSSSASSTSSPTLSASPSVVTIGGQTVVVTAGATTNAASGSSPNKAAIAAGVVVGFVAFAAAAGGGFLYMRRRRNRQVEEEYRRNAAVNEFVAGGKSQHSGNTSFSDTRLDPTVMAQRRMSDGSIADNEDYSRRILKVTNA